VTPDNAAELREIEKLIGREIPYMKLEWDGSAESDQAIAARSNRKAARKDPEIAQAVREEKARKRKEAKKAEAQPQAKAKRKRAKKVANPVAEDSFESQATVAGKKPKGRKRVETPAPRKTRGTASKENKRNQRQAGAAKPARKKNRTGKRAAAAKDGFGGDFRPGRAQRRASRNK
jgi:ATP-dependent RNA helicase RhlE